MSIFKETPFGQVLFLKKWIIRILGLITHSRYKGFNMLEIEGSEFIRNLPEANVLFVSNHQTYFADVVAMFHVFNASLKGRDDNIKNLAYLWNPKLNFYYVAAKETMKKSLLTKIMAYSGSISIERTWRANGENVNRRRRERERDMPGISAFSLFCREKISRTDFATGGIESGK